MLPELPGPTPTPTARILYLGPDPIKIGTHMELLEPRGGETRVLLALHGFEESGLHLFIRLFPAIAPMLRETSIPYQHADLVGRIVGNLVHLVDEADEVVDLVGRMLADGIGPEDLGYLFALAGELADPQTATAVLTLAADLKTLADSL